MYNGVGLQTPRGSGTSGHVQASKFLAKPRPSSSAVGGGGTPDLPRTGSGLEGMRKPNKDILEHDRKRQVELRLLVLRDALEEQGYTEAEIEVRVEEERKAAETEAAAEEGRPAAQGKGYGRDKFLSCSVNVCSPFDFGSFPGILNSSIAYTQEDGRAL